MSASRTDRMVFIKQLVRDNKVRNQSELADLLREKGFEVVRTTVSRDVSELGLAKGEDGTYCLPEDLKLHSAVKIQARETRRAGNQVILITEPGAAQSLAAAIDAAQPEGVLGTIAGDDTILVIAQDEAAGERFQLKIDQLIG